MRRPTHSVSSSSSSSHSHSHSSIVSICGSLARHPSSVMFGFALGFITCSLIAVNMVLFGGYQQQHLNFSPSSADRALMSSLLGDASQIDSDIYNHIIHEDHTSAFLLHCLTSTPAPPHSLIVPTRTHPSFALTIQDPSRDPYISKALLQYGVWDAHILHVVSPLLQHNCMRSVASLTPANAGSFSRKKRQREQQQGEYEDEESPPSPIQRSRIIEINANVAFFSLYAASMGCDVVIYEPVPAHFQCIQTSICANPSLGPRLTVSPHAITLAHNSTTTVYTGQHFGRRGTDVAINSVDCRDGHNSQHCKNATGVNLDRELEKAGDIFLIKINLDQNTLQIVKSMMKLLKASKVQYIVMAFAPKLYGLDDAQKILRTMDDNGYEATEILYTDTSTSAATQNKDSQKSFLQRIRSVMSFQSLLQQKTRRIDGRDVDNYVLNVFQCQDVSKLCYVDLLFTLKVTALQV